MVSDDSGRDVVGDWLAGWGGGLEVGDGVSSWGGNEVRGVGIGCACVGREGRGIVRTGLPLIVHKQSTVRSEAARSKK